MVPHEDDILLTKGRLNNVILLWSYDRKWRSTITGTVHAHENTSDIALVMQMSVCHVIKFIGKVLVTIHRTNVT